MGVAEGILAEGDKEIDGAGVGLAVGKGEDWSNVGILDGGFEIKNGELEDVSAVKNTKATLVRLIDPSQSGKFHKT